MKNVAGFDVSRLLCGSLGMLGIITEVSLKVLPLPRAEATLQLELPAARPWRASTASPGSRCRFPRPPGTRASPGCACRARPLRYGRRARASAGNCSRRQARSAWWQGLRDCTLPFFAAPSLWRLSLPSTAAPLSLGPEPLIDWGGAVRWYAGIAPGIDVRAQARAAGGTALHWRGAAPGQRFHPLSAEQPRAASASEGALRSAGHFQSRTSHCRDVSTPAPTAPAVARGRQLVRIRA